MFDLIRKEINFHGKSLALETGEVARLADGSVFVKYGATYVLCSVVFNKDKGVKNDFLPLTVVYQEKLFSNGRIPGGFLKREAKPTENEVLTSRLIDRSIRPLFDPNFVNEVQVICTVFSYDSSHSPDFAAIVGASAALRISGVPFYHTIAGVKIGYKDGEYLVNPSSNPNSSLDLFVSGTKDSVLMVESEAKELSDDVMINAISFASSQISVLCEFIDDFVSSASSASAKSTFVPEKREIESIKNSIKQSFYSEISDSFKIQSKFERSSKIAEIKTKVISSLAPEGSDEALKSLVSEAYKDVQKDVVRNRILEEGLRIDGRKVDEIRPISIKLDVLPGCHGSALFTRGETQALVALTLGGQTEEQMIEGLEGVHKERFLLHYNFPAYSVGEVGRYSGPGRREIGHGKLAYRAIKPLLPSKDSFPYTIRISSEITESNGSSSMATVCGGCLSLFSGGVPIKSVISGIAMGLVKEGDRFAILSDILGDEDHLGDMDFKVAGTANGITALQMDIKITGISMEILSQAVKQAMSGKEHIANKMNEALKAKSESGDSNAANSNKPHSFMIQVERDRVGEIIGQGGSVIKSIEEKSGANINISREGLVTITGNESSVNKARKIIESILVKVEYGKIVKGVISRVTESYAIVEIGDGKNGLLHISEICDSRIDCDMSDMMFEGENVVVKILPSDDSRIKLTMKGINQENGIEG